MGARSKMGAPAAEGQQQLLLLQLAACKFPPRQWLSDIAHVRKGTRLNLTLRWWTCGLHCAELHMDISAVQPGRQPLLPVSREGGARHGQYCAGWALHEVLRQSLVVGTGNISKCAHPASLYTQ